MPSIIKSVEVIRVQTMADRKTVRFVIETTNSTAEDITTGYELMSEDTVMILMDKKSFDESQIEDSV